MKFEDLYRKLDESSLPDVGETISFEDEIETKIKGKKVVFEPNTEFQVISKVGKQLTLLSEKGEFYITEAEYKALGGYLV